MNLFTKFSVVLSAVTTEIVTGDFKKQWVLGGCSIGRMEMSCIVMNFCFFFYLERNNLMQGFLLFVLTGKKQLDARTFAVCSN